MWSGKLSGTASHRAALKSAPSILNTSSLGYLNLQGTQTGFSRKVPNTTELLFLSISPLSLFFFFFLVQSRNHLLNRIQVSSTRAHVCLLSKVLPVRELIRLQHRRCNIKVKLEYYCHKRPTRTRACVITKKDPFFMCQSLQMHSSQGSISQPVLSSRILRDGSFVKPPTVPHTKKTGCSLMNLLSQCHRANFHRCSQEPW